MDTLEPSSTVIEVRLAQLFPPAWLDQRARAHDVIFHDRKPNITAMVWALTLGFTIRATRSIEELRRTSVRFADHHLHPSSFHDHLSVDLGALLRELIEEGVAKTAAPHTMIDHLDRIRDVVMADPTIVQLHEFLDKDFPATHDDRGGAKVQLVHNVTDETVSDLDIADEHYHDSILCRKRSGLRDCSSWSIWPISSPPASLASMKTAGTSWSD